MRQSLIFRLNLKFDKWNGNILHNLVLVVLKYNKCSIYRGGKDFFVVILEGMIFVKGTGKHWSKYQNFLKQNAITYLGVGVW